MTQENQVSKEKLEQLNEFGKRFMELKAYILKLELSSQENVRLCIERLDDGFLRGREAIFSLPIVNEFPDENEKVANDPIPVEDDEIPFAATN